MAFLLSLARGIDRFNGWIGLVCTWMMVPVVLLSTAVVVLRYAFGTGYPWLNESSVWLHGAIVLVAAAYVLSIEKHVRVDVFYRDASYRYKSLVNIVGILVFVAPFIYILYTHALPMAERSWRIREASPTPNGLPFMYAIKILIPVFCVLIAVQALSLLIKSVAVLTGDERWRHLLNHDAHASDGSQGA